MTLIGCDERTQMKRLTPSQDDRVARDLIDGLATADSTKILSHLSASVQQLPGFRDSLNGIASALPRGRIDTIRQVGVYRNLSSNSTRLAYELHSPAGWAVATFFIEDDAGTRAISSAHVQRIEDSLENLNSFWRAGNPLRAIVLLVAVFAAFFSVVVAVLAARQRIKRRWLWVLFALVGASPFTLNWTTGEVSFQLLQVVLLSAGIGRAGMFGPWLITIAFPIGAIATLHRIRRQQVEPDAPFAETVEPTTAKPEPSPQGD